MVESSKMRPVSVMLDGRRRGSAAGPFVPVSPLSDSDPSGLPAMRHADVHPDACDPRNFVPGAQFASGKLRDGRCLDSNVGQGNDVIRAGAGIGGGVSDDMYCVEGTVADRRDAWFNNVRSDEAADLLVGLFAQTRLRQLERRHA